MNNLLFSEADYFTFTKESVKISSKLINKEICTIGRLDSVRFNLVYSQYYLTLCNCLNISLNDLFLNTKISTDILIEIKKRYTSLNFNKSYFKVLLFFLNSINYFKKEIYSVLDFFYKNSSLLRKIDYTNSEQVHDLQIYFDMSFTPCALSINSISQLINIQKYRKKILIKIIKSSNYSTCKYIMSLVLFGQNSYKDIIKDATHLNSRIELPKDIMNKVNKICELDSIYSPESFISYLDNVGDNPEDYVNDIVLCIKEYATKDLVKNLNRPIKLQDVYELNGEPFIFLIHSLMGLTNQSIKEKLLNNIAEWNKNYYPNSILSTSLINQYYFGNASYGSVFFGFANISNSDIIDMGLQDLYSEYQYYLTNIFSHNSRFILTDEFLDQSHGSYNEIVLKRFIDKKSIMPSYILSFDRISDYSKELARYFNVPIYVLNSFKYAELMCSHFNYLFEQGKIEAYERYVSKMIYSFDHENDFLSNYLKEENMTFKVNKLIKKRECGLLSTNKPIYNLINFYDAIISIENLKSSFSSEEYYQKVKKL